MSRQQTMPADIRAVLYHTCGRNSAPTTSALPSNAPPPMLCVACQQAEGLMDRLAPQGALPSGEDD